VRSTLRELLFEARPGFACGQEDPNGIFQFRMHNVSKSSDLLLSKRRRIPLNSHRRLDEYYVSPGDVLFNATNSPDNTGKSILVPKLDEPAVYSNHFFRLRTNPAQLDSKYLWRYLQWQFRRGAFLGLTRQWVNQATISREDLLGLKLNPPNLDSQRRITAVLDEADAIRAKRRTQLAHLDELPRALFHDMFGALNADAIVSGLAANTKGAIRTGPFGSQLLHDEFVDSGIAVLGLDNVVGNTFGWAKRRFITPEKYAKLRRYTVHPGDVLISIMGTVGRCVVVPDDIETAINTKHICAITLDHEIAHPAFVRAAFLWHPASRRHLAHETKGAIMAGLNMGIIKKMPLPLPPLNDQQKFAERTAAIHDERDRVAHALQADDELFEALQHRAFRGEL